jgi:cardiolipin synthase
VPTLVEKLIPPPRDKYHEARRHATAYKTLAVLALVSLALQTSLLLIALFGKPLSYEIHDAGSESLQSPELARILAVQTGGGMYGNNRIEALTNGEAFYESELNAIAAAKRFVHIECYIFQKGRLTDRVLQALEERARAGVEVRMVVDAVGSTSFPDSRFDPLRRAGGRVHWYHPLRWYNWPLANNRTHREIVVVDGTIGFAGGAGFADQWIYGSKDEPRWRDTMVRLEGEAASVLDATFAENWLETSGELLASPKYFPFHSGGGKTQALVLTSSPTSGRSTEAHMLFQILAAKAASRIHITTPYFLPDESLRNELAKAMRERKVEVTILVPGGKSDHLLTRGSSRSLYGDLLRGGARIFEYQPTMIHAKIMLVDGYWAVAGSTNLDLRSFGLNDEVNIAIPDPEVVRRLEADFERDLSVSRQISYEEWKSRPVWERIVERFGWLIMNQQ